MSDAEDKALIRYDELAIPAMWLGHFAALVVFMMAQLLPTIQHGTWHPYSALEMLESINLSANHFPDMVVDALAFLNGPLTILILTFLIINLIFPALAWMSVGASPPEKEDEHSDRPPHEGSFRGSGWLKKRK